MASALTLATTMSRPPSSAVVSSTHCRTPASSETSTQRPVTTPPRAVISSAARVTSAVVRAQKATAAPASASVSTMARPMPLVPPVTRARNPLSPRSTATSSPLRTRIIPNWPPAAVSDPLSRLAGLPGGPGQLAEPPVHAVVGVRRGQQALAYLRDRAVVDVHHVGQRALAHLGEQLVGVELVQPVQVAQPADHARLADPPGVLQRSARAHHHEVVVGLEPRPGRPAALDQVHDEADVHRALHRGPAGLALALPVVAVADGEQRARHVDPQVAAGAGAHLGGIHVPAEGVRDQRGPHLAG